MRITNHITFLLFSVFLLASCGAKKKEVGLVAQTTDLKEIIESDTLRVATMYGSTSYFLYRDEMMGFDYEMVGNLANNLNVNLKINIAKDEEEMTQWLREDKVDIACYNFIETKALKEHFQFVLPQSESYQVLVQNLSANPLSDISELAGKSVYVKANSVFHQRLQAINDEIGGTINIVLAADSLSNEDLIDMVGEKKIDYTFAYHNMALLHKSFYRDIDCRMPVSFGQHNGWLIRKGNPNLQKAIETWEKLPEIVDLQSSLFDKYWDESPYFALKRIRIPKGAISPFDHLFKKYAPLIGWDWQLLAAVAFHESRFDASERSWAGAVGLMQLMPHTASNFGLNSTTKLDPEMNIEAGVQYIKSLSMTFRAVADKNERIKFILAGYNSGPAHVLDAMALAKKYGKNPQVWFNNVEYYLLKKSEPEFYQDKVVKYGFYRGKITARYVHDVLETREKYMRRK
jgi:membrane-bound lytic murein transglycosylase F